MLIAAEQDRPLASLPDEVAISVMTLAELRVGVLVATEPNARAQRMRTLERLEPLQALPVDEGVAREFAEIVASARSEGRRPKIIDGLIAATALAAGLPLCTQDADFEGIRGLEVLRV